MVLLDELDALVDGNAKEKQQEGQPSFFADEV